MSHQLRGSLVHVRFLDHCWFRNADPSLAKPIAQEAWGILIEETGSYSKLLAVYQNPTFHRCLGPVVPYKMDRPREGKGRQSRAVGLALKPAEDRPKPSDDPEQTQL